MKKTPAAHFTLITLAATALALVAWMSVASATPLLEDHFQYPDGNLIQLGNGWYGHSGTSNPVLVEGARTVFQQVATGSRQDDSKRFAARLATDKTYGSCTLVVPSGATLTTDGYFMHFKSVGTDSTAFKARVYVSPYTGGDYTVGVSVTSSGTSPVVRWASPLTFGVRYRLVFSYDATAGTAELWVDPVDESSTKVSSTNASGAGTAIAAVCLRQANEQVSTEYVDDVYVGTTFADVTATYVPAAGMWGLIALALLMAGVGVAFVLRRRQAVA